ncbi:MULTISPECIES: DNA topoisomerase [Methylobacterium]|jgi:DNA topoisomerase-3|uniref:type IA DNA topoisomerase n=2 Tax=Methylobacteriaceae TaxID=119045 RepID=UPI0008F2FF54|nr:MULTISPECIES: DNA topoisomerase [Methylobacterium]MBK3395584.1 DNA topoisomerase [Methylobacterium ajmalii]MBK3408690.1 DNA topoisomerase [Methylobacterium ajmalii]MBZ6415773.1 DNA topoisomerase [Methylobacterium sp.]SFE33722.1 DNA topoisomerase-3 [Methylobacterium sp. yr596]
MAQATSPGSSSGTNPRGKTLFFFEKPSAMRQVQRFFRSPSTVCVAAEGHLLEVAEPGEIRPDWKPWRFDALPIAMERLPVAPGHGRSGQSHAPKLAAIRQALSGVERVIIATDPGREGSMIAWEVLEHLGWRGRVDRLRLGALDEISIRRAFGLLAREDDSGERDYAAYLEALCRQYEDWHLGLNGTRAVSLRLRPPAFREPWRFGGVQTPTLAILADLEERIRTFVPRDFYKIALPVTTESGARLTLWHAPKDKIFEIADAETIRDAAAGWAGPLAVVQKDVRRAPPKLFSKDTLARACAKRFGWDPQVTARHAQALYDKGYLSYPRTESVHLPESQAKDAAAVLAAIAVADKDLTAHNPATPQIRRGPKGHYVKDPGEHHAIVPLRKVPGPGDVAPEALRLWLLVAKNFLAAHMADGIDARTTVTAEVATPLGQKRFVITGSVVKVPGWRALYGTEADEDEVVPGKAKADDEPTTGRLPPVRDGEAGTGGDPTIETARTEPPRRITRGELPVVMGRLIDQIEDPALKRALENPANPTEPKGLGTAATRDAVLPKLMKSHYVTLLKGKDPAITVTEVGLAFVSAVRRVFPAYGDPVGRAVFESELAEIGRATTKAEAVRRAEAFRQRTRERVEALIGAVSGADRLEVDAEAPPRGGRAPTAAMVAFARSLAARKGIPLPPEATREVGACRVFLNTHAGPKIGAEKSGTEAGSPAGDGATRPPTPAMLRFAASLAREKRMEGLPPEIETDFAACRAFLDAHAGGDGSRGGKAPAREAPAKKAPAKKAPAKKARGPRAAASPGRAPRRRRAEA